MTEQKYWFKAHRYGYGWSPNTWQGWVTVLLYIIALVYSFIEVTKQFHTTSDIMLNFFLRVVIFSAILIIIAYFKGEPASWQWSRKNEKKDF